MLFPLSTSKYNITGEMKSNFTGFDVARAEKQVALGDGDISDLKGSCLGGFSTRSCRLHSVVWKRA